MMESATRDLSTDLRSAIDEAHRALAELALGNLDPSRGIYARAEHATLFGAYGGHDIGWSALTSRLDAIAPLVAEGGGEERVTVETVVAQQSGDLAYTVSFEHRHTSGDNAAPPGEANLVQTLRVTQIFQRVEGAWALIHRHADPLVNIQGALAAIGWTQTNSPQTT